MGTTRNAGHSHAHAVHPSYFLPSLFAPGFSVVLSLFFFSCCRFTLIGFHSLCGDRARGPCQLRPLRGKAGRHHRRGRRQQGVYDRVGRRYRNRLEFVRYRQRNNIVDTISIVDACYVVHGRFRSVSLITSKLALRIFENMEAFAQYF